MKFPEKGGGLPKNLPHEAVTSTGSVMTGEHAVRIGQLMGMKIAELRIKPGITQKEISFIDVVSRNGASCLLHGIERLRMNISDDMSAALVDAARPVLGEVGINAPGSGPIPEIKYVLATMAAESINTRGIGYRRYIESFGEIALSAFGEMISDVGEVQVDTYLAEKTREMFDSYTDVVKQGPQIQ